MSSELQEITQDVLFRRAFDQAKASSDPSLVAVFGWMGATLPQIGKYISGYQQLYPGSNILLVRSFPSNWLWKSADLSPAAKILQEHQGSDAKIFCHIMSNGGCLQATSLARSMQQANPSSPAIKAKAIVFDSCPGAATFSSYLRAFTIPFDKSSALVRYPLYFLFTAFFYVMKSYSTLFRIEDPTTKMRRSLLSTETFPASADRLYVYSKGDELISFETVEEEMARARKQLKGKVVAELYSTPHVAHMRSDPQRYWKSISDLWSGTM